MNFAIEQSWFEDEARLPLLKALVRKHDLRWVYNPVPIGGRVDVKIGADTSEAMNAFNREWHEKIAPPEPEPPTSFWGRLVARVKDLL
jgi:hypothetical protein